MASPSSIGLPSVQQLQTSEQMELLDVVDSLRAQGLGDITALPQLIVCGDQSSGKSSVLEAISGIPFPRKDNLCTRFATEVVLRRAAVQRITVSIIASRDRSAAEKHTLSQFRCDIDTEADFPQLFLDAKQAIGINDGGRSFSNDILRVEICGPSQPQLTLVDLPGLIHSEIGSQTAADLTLVKRLVTEYLKNPRSIILAVISAKNDIGNQAILRESRNVDPQGKRTLGIITKPDVLTPGSDNEDAFLDLAQNEKVPFALGWHVVKNLDLSNSKDLDRDEEEAKFFKRSNFNRLRADTLGIQCLRLRLSKVLFTQIRTELPRLVEELDSKMAACQAEQHKMGRGRAGVADQRMFLIELSQSFQSICADAVRGYYDHNFFKNNAEPEKRFCADLMNKHCAFAREIQDNGARWKIVGFADKDEKHRTRDEAIEEAYKLLQSSRGRELRGLPNPLLVGELFQQYSQPWQAIARRHIESVGETTNHFLKLVLSEIADGDVTDRVLRHWLNPLLSEKMKLAHAKLDELLDVHKEYPLTTTHTFLDNRRKLQHDKTRQQLYMKAMTETSRSNSTLTASDVSRMYDETFIRTEEDVDRIAAEDAFDNMNAYYKVAASLFMDNVPTLAIQAPIIRKLSETFSPRAVLSMSEALVTKLAGEPQEKVLVREQLSRRMAILTEGAKTCKQYELKNHNQSSSTSDIKSSMLSDISNAVDELVASNRSTQSPFGAPSSTVNAVPYGTTGSLFGGSYQVPAQGLFSGLSDGAASTTIPRATNPTTGSLFGGSSAGFAATSKSSSGSVLAGAQKTSSFGGFGGFGGFSSSLSGTQNSENHLPSFGAPLGGSGISFAQGVSKSKSATPAATSSPFGTPVGMSSQLAFPTEAESAKKKPAEAWYIENVPSTRMSILTNHGTPGGFMSREHDETDRVGSARFQNITGWTDFRDFSFEELRLRDQVDA